MLLRRFRRHKASSDPVTVVSRFVDAANRHDAEAIAKCLHPDFESIQPIYPSRNFRGSTQVRRNWQAIFESEPGFRLSLVRSSSAGNTVWVELHGAGRDVEVAGVFIMGVEDELVRWARVYSAVVEQPPPRMAAQPAPTDAAAMRPSSAQEQAEELRRVIDAGRPAGDEADGEGADGEGAEGEGATAEEAAAFADAVDAPDASGDTDSDEVGVVLVGGDATGDAAGDADAEGRLAAVAGADDSGADLTADADAEAVAATDVDASPSDAGPAAAVAADAGPAAAVAADDAASPAAEVAAAAAYASEGRLAAIGDESGAGDAGTVRDMDDDDFVEDDDEYDEYEDDEDDDEYDDEDDGDDGALEVEADGGQGVEGGGGPAVGQGGGAGRHVESAATTEPAKTVADEVDEFWAGGQVHDLVGGEKRRRKSTPDQPQTGSALGWGDDEDAMVVDFSGWQGESGDDPDDPGGRSGRRRGGRRRR
ncbi:MAG TPA: nuclear transport factor 2 family protein [Acidimicrobiales bacterium]|nr:nuclear transport factor 2 family protein [Acidimicrobiales bacterium]